MPKKLIKALIASVGIIIIPTVGNISILYAPHLWILLFIGILASYLQPDYHIVKDKSNSYDKGTEIQIIWSVYITQLAAIIETTYIRFPNSVKWDIISTSTLVVMLLGLALRTWSVYTLGEYYTMHLTIFKEHKLICSGPYKYIRHPAYVGAFLTYVGTTVFLHTWFSLILALIILPVAWLRRIYVEENLLFEKFGKKYTSYCKSVKRVIPYIW